MRKVKAVDNVIPAEELSELRESLERLEAQRRCMRIPDPYWRAMKRRAKKSKRPLAEALQGELSACAYKILQFM